MNIILVSDGVGRSRTITLSQTHIVVIALGILLAGFLLAFVTYGITLRAAADIQNPFVQSLVSSLQREQIRAQESQMKDNLNSLAKKVGELQARLHERSCPWRTAGSRPRACGFPLPTGRRKGAQGAACIS